MKGKKAETLRVESLLQSDRLNVKDEFVNLLISDIDKTLNEYFEYSSLPKIMINKVNGKILFSVTLEADKLKNFLTVPSTEIKN